MSGNAHTAAPRRGAFKAAEDTPTRAALYMRLSRDGEGAGESAGIAAQRALLRAYCAEHGFAVYDEYVDDGVSGTTFERPGFQRMLGDIERGRVNLVVTKDLSRLGRDYIGAGGYTERYFPEHGVRYIAVNDGYDSGGGRDDAAPFRHVVNEMYARDTSRKIRSALETKMREGAYIGSFAPYGYQKDPADKNHLVADAVTAPVVRDIFRWAKEGARPCDIARRLNERGVPSPAQYRRRRYPGAGRDGACAPGRWTSGTIHKLLGDVVYLGHMAQGKTRKPSFKSGDTLRRAAEEWYVVENTHQPLVSRDTFELIRRRPTPRKRPAAPGVQNVFAGIAYCAGCGRAMTPAGGAGGGLVCGGYKRYGNRVCTSHRIDYEDLCQVVRRELQAQLCFSNGDRIELLEGLREDTPGGDGGELARELRWMQTRVEELAWLLRHMEGDCLSGKISRQRCQRLSGPPERELRGLERRLEEQRDEAPGAPPDLADLLGELTRMQTLSPELVHKLIDRIEIGRESGEDTRGGRQRTRKIKICFRFAQADGEQPRR